MNYKEILNQQLAEDFCCTAEAVASKDHIFTYYEERPGRRTFDSGSCYLKIACVHGKLLVTGQREILDWCREKYRDAKAPWFMEYQSLYRLDLKLRESGYTIGTAHPFFLPDATKEVTVPEGETEWFRGKEIEQFRGDDRFDEAFAFKEDAPDLLGVCLKRAGKICGMAGASRDCAKMYQIGINVMPEAEGEHIGTYLVNLLKEELLRQGILPFYGTSTSHVTSQNVAVHAGFAPAWTELCSVLVKG